MNKTVENKNNKDDYIETLSKEKEAKEAINFYRKIKYKILRREVNVC